MSTPLHETHKQMLRHILGLDSVSQYFDGGGTVLSGPSQTTSSNPGSTPGLNAITHQLNPSGNDWSNAYDPAQWLNTLQNATQNNFQATGANLQPGTNVDQLNSAYNQAQTGINNQNALVGALQNTNGIANQNQAAEGFSDIANGTGPNVAQSMLNQSTGQNIANQAALMAGQRGVGANAGLLARQAAMQGANTQQQAAGQGATLQAQQQQAALEHLGNIGTNQISALGQAIGGQNTATQNEQNILQNANNSFNNANVGMQSNLNNVNAGVSENNQAASNNLLGGLMNGAGSLISSLFAKGGEVGDSKRILANALSKKIMPDHMRAMAEIYHPKVLKMASGGEADGDVEENLGNTNYTSPAADSSPNIGSSTPVNEGNAFASSSGGSSGGGGAGGLGALAALMDRGGTVAPGKEPKVPNKNTTKNDVVPAMLTPKEIVLPLSVTQSENPGDAAKAFVEKIKGISGSDDFKKALSAHVMKRKFKK